MTQEETLKRIEEEGWEVVERDHLHSADYPLNHWFVKGFIAGAKSERNKTIDEAIGRLKDAAETSDEIFGVVFMCCIQELESLKVDL